MSTRECPDCGGFGEVPTADTEHLASTRVGGFEHPDMRFVRCMTCNGHGVVPDTEGEAR